MHLGPQGTAFLPDGGILPGGAYPVYASLEVDGDGAASGEVHFACEPKHPPPVSIGVEFDIHVPYPDSILGDTVNMRVKLVDGSGSITGYVIGSSAQFRPQGKIKHASGEDDEKDDLLPVLRRKVFDRDLLALSSVATESEPVSLLILDLDHFKAVNDTHGHPVGDEVLIECAHAIVRRSRLKGKVYRFGGEEIAVLLTNFTVSEAFALAESIRSEIATSKMSSKKLSITASIGVATAPVHAAEGKQLLKVADEALYTAKHLGRNLVRIAGEDHSTPSQAAVTNASPDSEREKNTETVASQSLAKTKQSNLPAVRPIIVPKRYGDGLLKTHLGYTGLAIVNEGDAAYDITISNVLIENGNRLEFQCGHTDRLTKDDGEAFYPCFIAARLGGTFGSELCDFMRERGIEALTVPITYRDDHNHWFQTDITLVRDVEKPNGLTLNWHQKRISDPAEPDKPPIDVRDKRNAETERGSKPVDRWLGLFALAVGVALYLLPKTEPVIIGCCILIWGSLVHAVLKFWWVEDHKWRQILAAMLLTVGVVLLGLNIRPEESHERQEERKGEGISAVPPMVKNEPSQSTQPAPGHGTDESRDSTPSQATTTHVGDSIGNLARLGWTVKNPAVFEISAKPLPNMQESAVYFRALHKAFRLHFQQVSSVAGLHFLAGSDCVGIEIGASDIEDVSELGGITNLRELTIAIRRPSAMF